MQSELQHGSSFCSRRPVASDAYVEIWVGRLQRILSSISKLGVTHVSRLV